jgi:hypothetical protein
MKKLKILLCAAISTALLCACGSKVDEEQIPVFPTGEPINSGNTEQTGNDDPGDTNTSTAPSESIDDTLPPKEGMLRSRLSNEWVDADVANTRPIAVMTPNEINAIPHYGLSEASVLYEANVEGRMTRMLAIYEGWENMEKIGNIRSLRLYYGYWATEWDAFIVHFGGPYFVDNFLAEATTQNINGNAGGDSGAFFRSTDRKAPHNAYATGEGLLSVINKKGYSLSYRGLSDDQHYQFTSKASPNTLDQYSNAVDATKIDMSGCYPLTRCRFEYNASDGLYYRFQHLSGGEDGPHIDASNNEQLTFTNILVQNIYTEVLGTPDYLAMQCHDTTRDGWYFTNGKGIHVNWKKSSDYGATRYYDDNGNEITLNTGKTMVLIVEEGDTFNYE